MYLNSGRVSNFTLEKFCLNLWTNATISTLLCLFFLVYRQIRGDSDTFKQKLSAKSRGLKENY